MVLPVPVASETVVQADLTRVDFRTEPYVNEENATIDWFGTKGDDGRYYLTARFHQTNVATMQTQRLQFYLKLDAVQMNAGVLDEYTVADAGDAAGARAAFSHTGAVAAADGKKLHIGLA